MIPFSTLYPDILIEVPGCPLPLVKHHIIQVLADFCTETRILKETLPGINVVANTAQYPLSATLPGYVPVRTEEAWLNGEPLDPADVDQLNATLTNWRTETGSPAVFVDEDATGTLTLVPVPDTSIATGLVARISYTLDLVSPPTTFPEILYRNHAKGLAAGVKARLMDMPGKTWSNPELAAKRELEYKQAIATAKSKGDRSKTRARRRTKSYYR